MNIQIERVDDIDFALLAEEVNGVFNGQTSIKLYGNTIESLGEEPDPVAFQAVLDAHVANAPARELQKSIKQYVAAVQAHLDTKAAERNYDGILSLCTYATSTNLTFKAEGQAGVEWRDAVWATCYATLANVQSQTIPAPTLDELIAMLPALVWPT